MNLNNKSVLVIGFGVTGKSAVDYLMTQKANITVADRGDFSKNPSVSLYLEQGIRFYFGVDAMKAFDDEYDLIIKSPGINPKEELVQAALTKAPMITDVELAYRIASVDIIGITGSNGKTTTTSMIGEMLKKRPLGTTFVSGNIGIPVLEVISKATEQDCVVMELSSFQLEYTEKFQPQIAVICNIFEAHLDHHVTREAYVAAKMKLVANMTEDNFVIYNADSEELRTLISSSVAQKVPFAIESVDSFVRQNGSYIENDSVYFRGEKIANINDMALPGTHNLENALAAIAVAKLQGVANDDIVYVLRTYLGMPHRLQQIADVSGRVFYNDSKSTNLYATTIALKSFMQPTIYIGGGKDRGDRFEELHPYLSHIKSAHLYGETREQMQIAFNTGGITDVYLHENLVDATTAAYREALAGDIVLLSPCCASWDQFRNFEERGNLFTETVNRLIKDFPYEKGEI